jgi:RNA polymerase sigma factor (sigma-70 family)
MVPSCGVSLDKIESLYRLRHARFLRVATAIVGDRERAFEAVQDAFADVIRSRETFRGDGTLEAWVWSAVVNASRRTRADPLPYPFQERHERAASQATDEPATTSSDLGELVSTLPERQRLVLFLRYYADLDYRGIADALGIEVGTVSATLSAAHGALREGLKEATG